MYVVCVYRVYMKSTRHLERGECLMDVGLESRRVVNEGRKLQASKPLSWPRVLPGPPGQGHGGTLRGLRWRRVDSICINSSVPWLEKARRILQRLQRLHGFRQCLQP